MLMLKPEATLEGFVAGVFASFAFFAVSIKYFVSESWFMQVPLRISLTPFDATASRLAEGPLYTKSLEQTLSFNGILVASSEFELHLLVITVFIAFVAPFGGFLFSGLKRAMR